MSQNNAQPFRRAQAMMSAIGAIMNASMGDTMLQQAKIAALGAYVSRGKGKGGKTRARHGQHMDQVRAARKVRNIQKHKRSA